jgi:methionyl-tRNA formyltransferase
MKIIFLGTPHFAVASLKALIASNHKIIAVVTQPDRPRNRGEVIGFSPVKECALKNGLKVLQYEKISLEGAAELKGLDPDIMITAAYGQILSQEILNVAKYGVLNVHASLLPKYRGAAPVQWAIICGEQKTGVTIMKTDIGIDTGDILLAQEIKIGANETAGDMLNRLGVLGAECIIDALCLIENGMAKFIRQKHSDATRFAMLKKSDGLIDWSKSAAQIYNLIRGVNPWPGAFAHYDGRLLKIWESQIVDFDGAQGTHKAAQSGDTAQSAQMLMQTVQNEHNVQNVQNTLVQNERNTRAQKNGEVICADIKRGLIIKCGSGALKITKLQSAGKKAADTAEFLKGNKILNGTVFY